MVVYIEIPNAVYESCFDISFSLIPICEFHSIVLILALVKYGTKGYIVYINVNLMDANVRSFCKYGLVFGTEGTCSLLLTQKLESSIL